MRRLFRTNLSASVLALSGLSLLAAPACDMDEQEYIALPGDKDDNPDGAGGKADAWDYTNDPRRLANNLEYTLEALPRSGRLTRPVWADRHEVFPEDAPIWSDTYWPTVDGSSNTRWQGAHVPSPLEKYDEVFNGQAPCDQPTLRCGEGAKTVWDEYLSCAGPAARWQSSVFQNGRRMYDGLDSNGDGTVDTCGYGDRDGIERWWGLCHAWAPASLLEPEPLRPVVYQGVEFAVADIKALIQTAYDSTSALMLGGRCNAQEIEVDENGRAVDPDCRDVNAGAMHVVVTNFLGINDNALVMDRTASAEVWNQPIEGYEITQQDLVDVQRAHACIGPVEGETYQFNGQAVELYEVRLNLRWVTEGSATRGPLGMAGFVRTDRLHYIIEVDGRGKVIGGEWCRASQKSHPDFLWAPLRADTSTWRRSNPHVDLEKVRTLINLSRQPEQPVEPGDGEDRSFENTTTVEIPDNDASGVTSDIAVTEDFTFDAVSVTVDIVHTWRGDLRVELVRDGVAVAVLHDREGGSADDLRQTYTRTAAELGGAAARGTWTLRVSDHAAQDTGALQTFKLTFHGVR